MDEWRECPFAGKLCAERYAADPSAFVEGTLPCEGRDCEVFGDRSMYCVQKHDCATCPVPPLVDAVEVTADMPVCEYALSGGISDCRECDNDKCSMKAALAVLAKAKGERGEDGAGK